MARNGEGTKFTLDRKIFSSDLWFDSPWVLKIWIYLLGHASHKDTRWMGIEIKRGQLIRSYRTIAKDCGYKVGYRLKKPSYDTVRRICEGFTKAERIEQRTVQCGTLFTILNYDKLQPMKHNESVNESVNEPFNDRSMTVQYKNVKNEKKKNIHTQLAEQVRLVFEHWKKVFGHPKAKLDDTRKRKIEARLNDGRTVEDFKQAIDNCKQDTWEDRGKHHDIELICRNNVKFEYFLNLKAKERPEKWIE